MDVLKKPQCGVDVFFVHWALSFLEPKYIYIKALYIISQA